MNIHKKKYIIIATDLQEGFAKDNKIPWKLKGDMKFFKQTTSYSPKGKMNAVIMGRKTFESMGCKLLPKRWNIILTSSKDIHPVNPDTPFSIFHSLEEAVRFCNEEETIYETYLIGGERVFSEALTTYTIDRIYKTVVFHNYDCDTFFTNIKNIYELKASTVPMYEENISYHMEIWEKRV